MEKPASPRLAWVTFDAPDRHGGGGSMRQSYLLQAVARHFQVDLYLASGDPDVEVVQAVHEVVRIPPERAAPSSRLRRRLSNLWVALAAGPPEAHVAKPALPAIAAELRARGPYDVVTLEHPGLLPLQRAVGTSRAWVLTLQNLGSVRAAQQALVTPGRRQAWVSRREAASAARLEERALERCDSVITVSKNDAALLSRATTTIPNGVDLNRFEVTPVPAEPRVVLTGTLGYLPNVDGIEWFASEVWPRVRAQVPGAQLSIVGRKPYPTVRALDGSEGITVVGDVPAIEPYVRAARVAVVPLRIGSGTRLKALDAFAAGRPVVGTSIGLEGLAVSSGVTAFVEDDPEAFAAAVVRLLVDDELCRALAQAGRAYAEQAHDWRRLGDDLAAHLLSLGGAPSLKTSA